MRLYLRPPWACLLAHKWFLHIYLPWKDFSSIHFLLPLKPGKHVACTTSCSLSFTNPEHVGWGLCPDSFCIYLLLASCVASFAIWNLKEIQAIPTHISMTCQSSLPLSSLFPSHQISHSAPKPPEPDWSSLTAISGEKVEEWGPDVQTNTPSMDEPVENHECVSCLIQMGGAKCCGQSKKWGQLWITVGMPDMWRKLCLGAREKDEGTLMSRKRSVMCGTEKEKEHQTKQQM